MNKKELDWAEIQKDHDGGMNLSFLSRKYECCIGTISKAFRSGKIIKRTIKRFWSKEDRARFSQKRKDWLLKNPDKHPWRKNDKFKSKPCEKMKSFLRERGYVFLEEYIPLKDRFYSIDIAFPERKIGIEINGQQHYDEIGNLKPYYQERHNLIEEKGWRLIELHYSVVYNHSLLDGLLIGILSERISEESLELFKNEQKRIREERLLSKKHICKKCKEIISGMTKTGLCVSCYSYSMRKVARPSKEELENLVRMLPMTKIGEKFGVSDQAVKKWCKSYEIKIPNMRGYWTKKKYLK